MPESPRSLAPLSWAELRACGIGAWYPHLRRFSIRSVLVPLPRDFADYLVADGVVIPSTEDEPPYGDESVSPVGARPSACGPGAPDAGQCMPGQAQTGSPRRVYARDASREGQAQHGGGDDDDSDIAVSDDTSERSDAPTPSLPASFATVRRAIDEAINKLGGAVLPKLNWSAPTDAAWVLGGSLKCVSSDDVLLLLQSSDRVAHDLTEAMHLCGGADSGGPAAGGGGDGRCGGGDGTCDGGDGGHCDGGDGGHCFGRGCGSGGGGGDGGGREGGSGNGGGRDGGGRDGGGGARDGASDPHADHSCAVESPRSPNWVLALRKWCELDPSREFRCFRGTSGHFLAACQRDRSNHHPHLFPARGETLRLLSDFGRAHLPPWPVGLVWDAYVDRSNKVHLIDLAPFHESIDPVLLSWEELRRMDAACARGDAAYTAGGDASGEDASAGGAAFPSDDGCTAVSDAAVNGAAVNGAAVNGAAVNGAAVNRPAVNGTGARAVGEATETEEGGGLLLSPSAATADGGTGALNSDDDRRVKAEVRWVAEIRLVEAGAPLAPSASVYHGWPKELRELGQADLQGLISVAKRAAGSPHE
jgi:hypothetical protein